MTWTHEKMVRRQVLIDRENDDYDELTRAEEDELDRLQEEFGEWQDSLCPLPRGGVKPIDEWGWSEWVVGFVGAVLSVYVVYVLLRLVGAC